jgi:cell division protein FtsI (penicillin-binding protein 3)
VRVADIPAFRGMILDRNGHPLAVSAEVYSVWVNPQEFSISSANWRLLHRYLAINPVQAKLVLQHEKNKGREFVYIRRGIDPELAERLKKQQLPGIYMQREYKRFYPEGEVTSQLLGSTNVDDKGQEGLELAYNDWLQGVPGKKVVLRDRLGHVVSDIKPLREQKPGQHLILSIDRRIQYLAYRELMEGVKENLAQSGTAIVLNAKTGEVLAMVNYPSFNPNHPRAVGGSGYRNLAVTDVFEPGSTIKSFSAACALASGKFTPDTPIDTFPGWIRLGHNLVHDESNKGVLTLTQVLQLSSDVGTTKMILTLPPQRLWELLHRVGFGETTNIEFPGEQTGVLEQRRVWSPFVLATLSFGYGMSATPIQLTRAYAVLANNGIKMPVTLIRRDHPPAGELVMDPKIAKEMLGVLESVLDKGATGAPARVPEFRVAGKTGTVRMLGAGGYQAHHHFSSFVGIAPVSHPTLVVSVIVRDPLGKHYMGGHVSGPIFAKIMGGALRIMDIQPDAVGA